MKTTILTITEVEDAPDALTIEIAKVHIPPVAEPLKLLVKLLQTVDEENPKKPKKTRADKGTKRPPRLLPDAANGERSQVIP